MNRSTETIIGERRCPRKAAHPEHTFISWVSTGIPSTAAEVEGRFYCPGGSEPMLANNWGHETLSALA